MEDTLRASTTVFDGITLEIHTKQGRRPRNAPKDAPRPTVYVGKLLCTPTQLTPFIGGGDTRRGEEILNRIVSDAIQDAVDEALKQAYDSKNDSFNPVKFEQVFVEYLQPSTRVSARKNIEAIAAEVQKLTAELVELAGRQQQGQLDEASLNRLNALLVRISELKQQFENR